ncbi:MAG TPA: DUF4412 domain-containing protein [Acidobacteriota bacterium]|nr:DUF4412 domain-containing protein [Acidobacteriota bacterium]
MKKFVSLVICLTLMSVGLWAGVVVESTVTDLSSNQTHPQKMWAQDGLLRMDVEDPSEDNTSILFLGDRVVFVNHDERSYMEMDEETMREVGAKLSEAQRMLDQQLKNLPEAQRKQMEKMMKDRMGAMMGDVMEPPRVERAGSGSAAGYDCTRYDVLRKDEKIVELCAAPSSALEGGQELVESFHSMTAFMEDFLQSIPQASEMAQGYLGAFSEIDGFPVMSRRFQNGRAVEETEIKSIESSSLGGDVFAIPSGYKKQKMMGR